MSLKLKMINRMSDDHYCNNNVTLFSQKATRKTDKVRPEDIDVTELSNEGLKDLLLKYGLNAGPIVGELVLRFKLNNTV